MVDCPNCGMDAGESKFCPNCGTKIEIIEESGSICPNCGTDAGESNFCPNCGTKIVREESPSICPNCGTDVGGSNFCPNCGTKIGAEEPSNNCPNCGKTLNESAKFCPYCGWSDSQDKSNSSLDTLIDVDDKISSKFSKVMGKSKSMDFILDKSASIRYNRNSELSESNLKYFRKVEPIFLEALDLIEDEFVKSVLVVQRMGMTNSGGVVGFVASQVYTPTKDFPHDKAIRFYLDMADKIIAEINTEKQKGTFDEERFFKSKVKESSIENMSVFGVSKSIKAWNKNKR